MILGPTWDQSRAHLTNPRRGLSPRCEPFRMRSFLFCLLLAVAASAGPIEIKAQPKAQGYTFNANGDWQIVTPNAYHKKNEKRPEDSDYPESIGGTAEYEKNAAQLIEMLKMVSPKEYEEVKLGSLRALLKRGKTEFHIYAGVGNTKIIIGYTDGRDSLDRTSYEPLLNEILSSFKMK